MRRVRLWVASSLADTSKEDMTAYVSGPYPRVNCAGSEQIDGVVR